MFPRRIDDLKLSAVTDSQLLFIQRSLRAASPWLDFENLETIVADRFDPETMGDLAVLGGKSKVEFLLRQKHLGDRQRLGNKNHNDYPQGGGNQTGFHAMPPVESPFFPL
jgi:hypothetical protein